MEDFALVDRRFSSHLNPDALLVVVADGHGSVPAYSETGAARDASRFIGGYECAALAARSVAEYVLRVSSLMRLQTLTKTDIACIMRDAFAYAQRRCEEETARGADRGAGAAEGRHAELARSLIDGRHFRDVMAARARCRPCDPRFLVADKVLRPYCGGLAVHYIGPDGRRGPPAEYGATVTALLFLPAPPLARAAGCAAVVYTAHVGDSDAYLFCRSERTPRAGPARRHGSGGVAAAGRSRAHPRACARTMSHDAPRPRGPDHGHGQAATPAPHYTPVRLTSDHTVANPQEVARLRALGMAPSGPYFVLRAGPERGQALMPSRAIGHTLLSKHGVACEPTVSAALLFPGDVVVVATDGLWAGYGRACGSGAAPAAGRGAATDEDLSAARVARFFAAFAQRRRPCPPAAEMARALRDDVVRSMPLRDNMVLTLVRVRECGEDTGPAPAAIVR
jgi:serine/threonine protein phosphatase PrpC